jgi:O-antigen/teichoic acid export membrane protein
VNTALRRGALYLTASTFFFMLAGYIVNVWLGRSLGPQLYGTYGVVISVLTIISIMQNSGIPQAVAKFTAGDAQSKSGSALLAGIKLQLISTITVAIIFELASPALASLLHDPNLTPLLRLAALVLPAYGIYSIYIGYFNGRHDFKRQAAANNTYAFSKIVSVIGLSYLIGVYGAISGFIISPLVALAFFGRLPSKQSTKTSYRPIVLYAIPLIVFAVISTLYLSLDLLFVKGLLYSDKLAAGYYTAAQNISLIPYYSVSAIGTVLFPAIAFNLSRQEANDKLIQKSIRYALLIVVPLVAIMSAFADPVIQIVYSKSYLSAATFLPVLLLGYGCLSLFTVLANVLNGGSKARLAVTSAAMGLAVTAILCPILIPKYQLLGAAISTATGAFFSALSASILVARHFGNPYRVLSLVRIISAGLLLYISCKVIHVPLAFYPVLGMAAFISYILALILMHEVRPEEIAIHRQEQPIRDRKNA